MIASTLLSLLLPALVSAHGYVNKVTIDGTVYPGNAVGTSATVSSAIRQVNTNSPVKGATSPDLNCGPGAQMAAQSANANPGSTVEVSWVGGTSGSTPVSPISSSYHVEDTFSPFRSGRTTWVRSCSTWPSARVPARPTTRVVPSGSRLQSKVINLAAPGIKQNSVRRSPFDQSSANTPPRVRITIVGYHPKYPCCRQLLASFRSHFAPKCHVPRWCRVLSLLRSIVCRWLSNWPALE